MSKERGGRWALQSRGSEVKLAVCSLLMHWQARCWGYEIKTQHSLDCKDLEPSAVVLENIFQFFRQKILHRYPKSKRRMMRVAPAGVEKGMTLNPSTPAKPPGPQMPLQTWGSPAPGSNSVPNLPCCFDTTPTTLPPTWHSDCHMSTG